MAQQETSMDSPSGTTADEMAPLILVAEDNEDNRLIAATMLRHVGYRVAEATTGAEAMELARSLDPALVLMDVGMPDIDGWTATRALKSDPKTRHIIIIAFTAHALPGDRELHARGDALPDRGSPRGRPGSEQHLTSVDGRGRLPDVGRPLLHAVSDGG